MRYGIVLLFNAAGESTLSTKPNIFSSCVSPSFFLYCVFEGLLSVDTSVLYTGYGHRKKHT